MARSEARIRTRIWRDEDLVALSPHAKLVYFALISQADVSHCGVLRMRLAYWQGRIGLSTKDMRAALVELEQRRYVVTDETTEELLIRSLLRNDEVWRQPNTFKTAARDASTVDSPRLRRALLAELDRVEPLLGELSTASPKNGRPAREIATEALSDMRRTLSDGISDGMQVPIPEGMPDGISDGMPDALPRALPLAPSPKPLSPSPIVPPTAGALDVRRDPPSAQDLIREHIDACQSRPPGSVVGQLAKQVKAMLDEGVRPEYIRGGLARFRSKPMHPSALPSLVNEVMNPPSATARPSTTDQRVSAALALAARYEQEDR